MWQDVVVECGMFTSCHEAVMVLFVVNANCLILSLHCSCLTSRIINVGLSYSWYEGIERKLKALFVISMHIVKYDTCNRYFFKDN